MAQPAPIEPPGRGLLDGRTVVITAAAGSGIGVRVEGAGGVCGVVSGGTDTWTDTLILLHLLLRVFALVHDSLGSQLMLDK